MRGTIGVVGLGYVGLPLAVQAAEKGYVVTGLDLNEQLVAMVNERRSPYVNDDRFEKAIARVDENLLHATTDSSKLGGVEIIIVCVPTPTDNNTPDLKYVTAAAEQIAANLKNGQLVVLESTVNPGVTRDVVLPILESASGLRVGRDFFLAHCPERIDPGNNKLFVGNLNRVVGGITDACTARAAAFYETVIDARIIPLGSTEEAEFVKSWENSHRNVMIALANSAAIICDSLGMDVGRVLEGLQSKVDQFGLKLAQPGLGPGGHCIPEDIHYVIKRARQNGIDTRFLDDAADLNDKMPRYAVFRLISMVKDAGEQMGDLRVALLGVAYKPDIADMRRSPSIEACFQLARYAKSVTVHDPYIKDVTTSLPTARYEDDLGRVLRAADAVFIGTSHTIYKKQLTPALFAKHGIRYILDGRNMLNKEEILAAGIGYRGIGR